ncbi:MAG: DNA-3-methyladenine glycosylase I, partial [Anaerolineae bacterium]|nr:DNA-3-methyladenine glycosylase I [Anaerolineae bacterium]
FEPARVADYGEVQVAALLANPGIVRNQSKIRAAITNAAAFLRVQQEFGSFDAYIWRFVDGKPVRNRWRAASEVPASTAASDALSRDLIGRGFKYAGSTICYAHMQATGMVNDHTVDCFRYLEV